MRKSFFKEISLFGLSALLSVALVGCQTTTTGVVRKDSSRTGQTDRVAEAGTNYTGPQYTIGILKLGNKTPAKVLGIGEAATDILRTMLKDAGLEPIMLTKSELKQHSRMMELQLSGVVKTGKKDATSGMDAIDYRVSGAITSYSELEEGSDILIAQSKTQIARVGVDYALVDIATGKTLVAKSGEGEYRKKSGGILGFGSSSSADVGLRDGALRDAMAKAVESMVKELSKRPFQGSILMVDGDSIIFRGGTRSRLEPGTKLAVYRKGKKLIDPETEHVLGVRKRKIGEIELVDHQSSKISEGSILSSKRKFKRGDIVKAVK